MSEGVDEFSPEELINLEGQLHETLSRIDKQIRA